jgi:LuxR family maltose regulon positive regulatory protein
VFAFIDRLLAMLGAASFSPVDKPGRAAPGAAPAVPAMSGEALVEPLSSRELEVLALVAQGHSNQEIARLMVISLHTVKGHLSNIFAKLGVKNRSQAVAHARRMSLLGE